MNYLKILNIFLVLICIILIINLFAPFDLIPSKLFLKLGFGTPIGNELHDWGPINISNTECYFKNSGESNEVPIDICCYQIQNLVKCTPDDDSYFKCYNSLESNRFYLVNQETLSYCIREEYDVKTE